MKSAGVEHFKLNIVEKYHYKMTNALNIGCKGGFCIMKTLFLILKKEGSYKRGRGVKGYMRKQTYGEKDEECRKCVH